MGEAENRCVNIAESTGAGSSQPHNPPPEQQEPLRAPGPFPFLTFIDIFLSSKVIGEIPCIPSAQWTATSVQNK